MNSQNSSPSSHMSPCEGIPQAPSPLPEAASSSQIVEQPLVTVGDIMVSRSWVVTPSGTRPVGGLVWNVSDLSTTTTGIPVWAIVCTIVFVWFFLLGLLFLLAKETKTQGVVQVTVQGPYFVHFTQIPVYHPSAVSDVNSRVNFARSLTAAAS
jgi:hypothetical protein